MFRNPSVKGKKNSVSRGAYKGHRGDHVSEVPCPFGARAFYPVLPLAGLDKKQTFSLISL